MWVTGGDRARLLVLGYGFGVGTAGWGFVPVSRRLSVGAERGRVERGCAAGAFLVADLGSPLVGVNVVRARFAARAARWLLRRGDRCGNDRGRHNNAPGTTGG